MYRLPGNYKVYPRSGSHGIVHNEALEIIDEIIDTLEQEHVAGVIARLGIHK